MDAQLPSTPVDTADEDFVALLAEQRARVQEFTSRRRQRLQDLESDLATRVERIADSLAELQQDSQGKLQHAEQQGSEVERSRAELESRLAEIERRDAQLSELNEVVARERAHVVTRARSIASRLRGQRHMLLQERQKDQAVIDAAATAEITSLRDGLLKSEAERDQARQEADSLRHLPGELTGLQQELAQLKEDATRLAAERVELDGAVDAKQQQLADEIKERERLAGVATAAQEALTSVTLERDRLAADVAALHADIAQAQGALADSSFQAQAVAELQAKLQQAEQERRQLQERLEQSAQQTARAEVAKLNEQLAKFQAAEQKAASEQAQLHGRCQELDAALVSVKAEFDRETQQASLRVQSLERDLAGARQDGNADNAMQQAAQKLVDEAQRQCAQLREELKSAQASAGSTSTLQVENDEISEQLTALEAARAELTEERDQLQQRLDTAATFEGGDQEIQDKIHSLEKRYSLAMEDLREEKARAAELEQKLAAARRGGGAVAVSGGGLDWEAQKLRMLAMLEEYDDGNEQEATARLTIQGTLEITDSIVAEKDQEIAELRKLLEEQSSNIGNMAVGASAIAQLLESDEVIQHERERVRQLQGEWEGKMRTAEVEISVERAKLARERAELEEKLRHLEERAATIGAQSPASGNSSSKEPKRGRWLERLGLKDSQS